MRQLMTITFLATLLSLYSPATQEKRIPGKTLKAKRIFSSVKIKDFAKKHSLLHGKVRGTLSITFDKLSSQISSLKKETQTLRATIKTHRDLPNIRYEWILPENVRLLEGDIQNHFSEIKKEQSFSITVKIEHSSEENHQVFLRSYSETENNGRLGYSASYFTKPITNKINTFSLTTKAGKPLRILQ